MPRKGQHQTNEAKQKISDGAKKYRARPEIKQKYSEINKGSNNPQYGTKHTKKWIKKHSLQMKGKGNPNYGKDISNLYGEKVSQGMKNVWRTDPRLINLRITKAMRLLKQRPVKRKKWSIELRNKMPNRSGVNNSFYGKKHSIESIMKMKKSKAEKGLPYWHTKIEQRMCKLLDLLHIKYKKHYNIYHEKLHFHQVDIMILDHENTAKIAIECDGCYWHACLQHFPNSIVGLNNRKRDLIIDECLKDLGIEVVRIWEHDIPENIVNLPKQLKHYDL